MAEFLWPADLAPAKTKLEILDNSGRSASPMSGFTRTVSRPGERTRMTLEYEYLNGQTRAQLQALVAAMRGGVNRVWVQDHSYRQRGSFSAAELAPSTTFANGLTGYTMGTAFSGAVTDRILRALRTKADGGTDGVVRLTTAATVTPFQPYVGRAIVTPHRGLSTDFGLRFGSSSFAADYASVTGLSDGLLSLAFVPYASTAHFGLVQGSSSKLAGDLFEIPFFSLAPCALVDNGPNDFVYSSDISNAAWTKTRASISSTSVTLPDGTSGTVNTLKEDATASNTHFLSKTITVAASAHDRCIAIAAKATAARSWIQLRLEEATGPTSVSAYFDLTNGVVGTGGSTGANWADRRTWIVSLGNGWYFCVMIARKTNNATSIEARYSIASADNTNSFNGGNQDSLYLWLPSFAASSVPMRLTSTDATAYPTGRSQNLAGGLYTKGWPVSTSGQLKMADQVQIGSRGYLLAGPIDSGAAGLAWTPLAQSMRAAPSDNDPVVINQPMWRFMLEPTENGWGNMPGLFSDSEIVLAEAA